MPRNIVFSTHISGCCVRSGCCDVMMRLMQRLYMTAVCMCVAVTFLSAYTSSYPSLSAVSLLFPLLMLRLPSRLSVILKGI